MERDDWSAQCLVLPDFSDSVLSAHRLHRKFVSRVHDRRNFCREKRTLVVGRSTRSVFVDDAREWHHLTADAGGGSGQSMVPRSTLALAMALDRRRPSRFRRLPALKLARFRRSIRLSLVAAGALPHALLVAMEWNRRRFSQSSADAELGRDSRDAGVDLYRPGLRLFCCQLDTTAADLRDVDHGKLATAGLRFIYRKHAALRRNDVPDLLPFRIRGRKWLLENGDRGLVDSFLCPVQWPLRARLVGLLTNPTVRRARTLRREAANSLRVGLGQPAIRFR